MSKIGRRILVVGSAGSGKSTLAEIIGQKYKLPVHHLDNIYWMPGWVKRPDAGFISRQKKMIAQPKWIIDGNYHRLGEARFKRADTLVFIDFSRWRCFWRIFKRTWKHIGRERPDLAPGCPDKVDWAFVVWVWNWNKRHREFWLNLGRAYPQLEVMHLTTPREADDFVAGL